MAVPVWPVELPQKVLHDGYSERPVDGRLRTQTDFGPGKVRRRYSSAARPVSCAILVPDTLVARFDRFWNEETSGGVMPFIMPDQIFNGAFLLDNFGNQITDQNGNPLLVSAFWLVRFGDAPTTTCVGAWFNIAFQIMVLP